MSHWLTGSLLGIAAAGLVFGGGYVLTNSRFNTEQYDQISVMPTLASTTKATTTPPVVTKPVWPLPLNTAAYNARLLALADYQPPATTSTTTIELTKIGTTTVRKKVTKLIPPVSPLRYSSTSNVTIAGKPWPPAAPYPDGGAILPFKRIVAYYGNFYSARMGVLGQYPIPTVLAKLASTTKEWAAADPTTPVLPAIEYIAVVAQGSAGPTGAYRSVMPDAQVDKAYALAQQIHGILILDIQVGQSTIQSILPMFKAYLEKPDVHLAIDPEFSMKGGTLPGHVIGTYDAADINYVINYLSDLVKQDHLPPKVLIVHRFTQGMITHYKDITPTPQVQVVINMDGWGSKELKRGTYTRVIETEPVQFTGVKLFYENDLKPPSTGLLTPQEVLALHPKPIYIQYQ